ncbi:hypothetical protein DRH13_02470 [Candidatus Woesebacteria bacterium]|nr:MAG: hypothetical protein DRH13_02470 [Candidatus Woesebacteria bacterium]
MEQSLATQSQIDQLVGMEFVPTFTRTGDTLAILASAYGVSAKDIIEANGLTWQRSVASAKQALSDYKIPFGGLTDSEIQTLARVNDINHWVLASNGKCLPFNPGSSFLKKKMQPCSSGGYAVFTSESEIMLPNKSRKNIPIKSMDEAAKAQLMAIASPPTSPVMLYGGIALGVVGLLYFLGKR